MTDPSLTPEAAAAVDALIAALARDLCQRISVAPGMHVEVDRLADRAHQVRALASLIAARVGTEPRR